MHLIIEADNGDLWVSKTDDTVVMIEDIYLDSYGIIHIDYQHEAFTVIDRHRTDAYSVFLKHFAPLSPYYDKKPEVGSTWHHKGNSMLVTISHIKGEFICFDIKDLTSGFLNKGDFLCAYEPT